MHEKVKAALDGALQKMGVSGVAYTIEFPGELSHGDLATNVALLAGKQAGLAPKAFAEKLVVEIGKIEGVEKISIAGPGFINFHFTRDTFSEIVLKIGEGLGTNDSLAGKKILIEKSAPNLFKPFHIGHLLNISVAESLSRLMRFSGAEVTDLAYPSDISLGVSKALWAIMKNGWQDELTIARMGDAYVQGTKAYDEDEAVKAEIIAINQKINAGTAGQEWDIYEKGKKINLDYFKTITTRLGSTFDGYFFESESGIVGKEIVEKNIGSVFEKSDGAVIFPGEKYGLHTRVFLTSLGLPVYEAKDIGLLKLKFEKYKPDISLVITDVEQKEYFRVIKQAATLINPEWGEKSRYWQHGRVRFVGGKISSRYGNVPLAEEVLDSVKTAIREKIAETNRVEGEEVETVSENLALASLRYAFLRSGSGKNIIFDFKTSISLEGDSGPYLEYALVRAKSLLERAGPQSMQSILAGAPAPLSDFERVLTRFPNAVLHAATDYEPHHLTTYLTELAGLFNSWYTSGKIIGDTEEAYKLALVRAFILTMQKGLHLLAIPEVEKM